MTKKPTQRYYCPYCDMVREQKEVSKVGIVDEGNKPSLLCIHCNMPVVDAKYERWWA